MFGGLRSAVRFDSCARIAVVQSETKQPEHDGKTRIKINDARRRALIELADVRDLEDQMRGITERLGGTIIKVGEERSVEERTSE